MESTFAVAIGAAIEEKIMKVPHQNGSCEKCGDGIMRLDSTDEVFPSDRFFANYICDECDHSEIVEVSAPDEGMTEIVPRVFL